MPDEELRLLMDDIERTTRISEGGTVQMKQPAGTFGSYARTFFSEILKKASRPFTHLSLGRWAYRVANTIEDGTDWVWVDVGDVNPGLEGELRRFLNAPRTR